MATYSTDLTTLTTAESGSWTEFDSPYNGAGTPAADGENFIQGTDCRSQTTGKAVGLAISIVYDYGSNYSFTTGYAVFAWCFYAVGVNIETYANSGWRFGIGSGTGTWDWFKIGGSDYGRNPYGGWINVAIDPTATETGTIGGGNGGSYRYFGSVPYTLNEISKGTPSAMDAVRVGRGVISVTGSGGSFSELAQYNDYNAGGTPPGSGSTSKDSGRHRFGLFQAQAGTYLWKGVLSLGTSGSSVTFSDSNETIIIDDCPHTYPDFNKVEVNNSGSSVTLNNVAFISTATTANGIGYWECVDDATVLLNGCSFNDMGTFVFQNSSTLTSCVFNSCGVITVGTASMDGCAFNSCEYVYVDTVAEANNVQGSTFVSSGSGHGLVIGDGTTTFTTQSVTIQDLVFSGYDTSDPGTAANKAIHVNSAAGGGTITLTISGGSGVSESYHVRATNCTVVVNADVSVTFAKMKDNSEVLVLNAATKAVIAHTEDATTGSTDNRSFTWSAPSSTVVDYIIHCFQPGDEIYESIRVEGYTVPSADTTLDIAQRRDRNAEN